MTLEHAKPGLTSPVSVVSRVRDIEDAISSILVNDSVPTPANKIISNKSPGKRQSDLFYLTAASVTSPSCEMASRAVARVPLPSRNS